MDLKLTGKRAVITGASRGIGLTVARALAAEGAVVGLVGRDRATLEQVADTFDGRAVPLPADTGQAESVTAMAAAALDALGGVDILVNCAARANRGSLSDDDLAEEINVKVAGYLRCCRAFAPGMAERGWGRIVNVSGLAARSTRSVVGSVRNVAVAAMTKNLADEYGRDGINVTVVYPGITVTESFDETIATMARAQHTTADAVKESLASAISLGRVMTAAEIADVICFLASPRSVAVTGEAIAVGGGVRGPIYY